MSEKLNDVFATYIESMEKFSESAKAFLQHVNLLNQARQEYQKASVASGDLRTALDSGDETLRILMTQLEKAVSAPLGEAILGKKKAESTPEPDKTEAVKAGGSGASVVRTFP